MSRRLALQAFGVGMLTACGGGGGDAGAGGGGGGGTGEAPAPAPGAPGPAPAPSPGASPEPIAADLANTTPENQAATFRNVDRLYATRVVRRGGSVAALGRHPVSLDTLRFSYQGSERSLDDYMQRNRTAGVLVMKNGAIATEKYGMGNDAGSRWTTFSLAKSVTSTLAGIAVRDGVMNLDEPVTRYVSALAGTAWDASTVRQLLRMTSGIRWDEAYDPAGDSDVVRLGQALGQPGQIMALMRTLPRAAAPGTRFNYSTGESYVLGAAVAGATGQNLSDSLSSRLWAPLGMEQDAYWVLDAAGGLETGGNSLSATLRDYGRFAQTVLAGTVTPAGWAALAGRPDNAVTAYGAIGAGTFGYGYQWWAFPDGSFIGQGIYGQFLYVNPAENVVAVVWSAWRPTWDAGAEAETYAMLDAAVRVLR